MSYYMVSSKQMFFMALSIAAMTAVGAFFVISLMSYFDLPEVSIDNEGKCVKVINFKNGDAYTCQDKDITLRKYHVVRV